MNLAIFLHSQKQYKDSALPLPLAPLYVLPHQKWYFSSAGLTPLRKRRENTSLFKYLQDLQILTEKLQKNSHNNFFESNRQLLCVYEKNNYFDNKIKHVFDTIYKQYCSDPYDKQKAKCECNQIIDEDTSKPFIVKVDTLNKCLSISKKNPKNETLTSEQQKINWYEFTKNLISESLNMQSHSIPEQSVYLFKLPQENNPYIFNVLWNDNYLIFNNGNKLEINQNMKSKAVELCESISKKLDEHIWSKIQGYIPRIAQDVGDHENFIYNLQKKVKVSTFRIWFYKKDANNQIYILNLSHLTFKGVECSLYHDFNIRTSSTGYEINKKQEIVIGANDLKEITQLNRSYQNRTRVFSMPKKSHKTLRTLINPTELQRMKNLLEDKHSDLTIIKPQQILIKEEEITEIQCSCCRNLMTANQTVNELTANHIEQIRYLRQIKIGKIQYSPYDFVKVCTLCYSAYLMHHKRQSIDKRNETNSLHNDKTAKSSQSFLEKPSLHFQDYKSRDSSFKFSKNSSKRLLFGKQSKQRAKSELNNSKQRPQFSMKEEKIIPKDRSISLRPPIFCPNKPKQKKIYTTHTTNTQNTILQREDLADLNSSKFIIARTSTQEEPTSIPNHNSLKFKNQRSNKTHHLINKIISNSLEAKKPKYESVQTQKQEALKLINTKIIMNAIDEYEKLQRFSFKKMITKNHRNYMIKEPSKQYLQGSENSDVHWKKSIKSYFQN